MSGMAQLKVRPEHLRGATHASDRRRYKRHEISLVGRYLRHLTQEEATCTLLDLSIGGASLLADKVPQMGERVLIQFNEFGGLEGEVVRVSPGGFAIDFIASHRRRQKLASQITWLLNRHELPANDQRRPGHERISIVAKPVRVELENGAISDRRILDVSISGASIAIAEKPAIGSEILVGRVSGRVVRHHARGVGVEFATIQNLASIREDFG